MKKYYENPELIVISFAIEDVITDSNGGNGGMGGPNEGEDGNLPD